MYQFISGSVCPQARRFRGAALLVGTVFFMSACAVAPKLQVDTLDASLDCTTFAWAETPDRPASIAEQRLRTEVLRALEGTGYAVDEATADCLVHGMIYTGVRPRSPVSVGLGAGRWGGSFGGSIGVSMPVGGRARTVGHLAIDVIDLDRNAEVWRGTLENAFATPDPGPEEIGAAVKQVMAEFPGRGTD
ncbi:MAG: DUF4136 domain-containing protein [Gammaproteobacteria bacterium]